MTEKKYLLTSFIAVLLLTGCDSQNINTGRMSRSITDPVFMEGNMSASAVASEPLTVNAAEVVPVDSAIKLAEFSTEFNSDDKARANNIKVASQAIDETVIYPGEVFSYNETVGPTTRANGYQKATIYNNGKKSKGYGGGVCQVSSTLYNTVEKAGMEVIERHPHSLPVYYVERGKDAATSYGVIDFKFENNRDYPIKINSWTSENELVVGIEAV